MRRARLSFGDGLIAEEVSDLRDDWMTCGGEVLADEGIIAILCEALAKRPQIAAAGAARRPTWCCLC
jgi:IS5 family transposase